MNKAITDGLVLMPPPFSAGLGLFSRVDGTAGSASYAGQSNAAYVPADQDFGGCLELQKLETTQRVRSYAQTPMQPGLYLQVTARVKAMSGNLPSVRIAGYAARSNGTNVTGVVQTGPSVTLTSYGEVVTVTAIVGVGNRQGVDMVWGREPIYGHFGLDLTGSNGGVVRIDDLMIEDVTSVFLRNLLDWVDVRDFGAVGDGTTDDSAAFAAADAAADGRAVLVSAGTYWLNSNVTISSKVRFEGTVMMPTQFRLACMRDFNFDTYASAFGSEDQGIRRGIQTLFFGPDHDAFDLGGRTVQVSSPIDVAAWAGITNFAQRRVLMNGTLDAQTSTAWNDETVSSVATYTPTTAPLALTNVINVANIPVGALITGTGVGREIYVTSKNVGAGTVELNRPLYGAAGTRTFQFRRFKYILDFSGFSAMSRFEIADVEFACNGRASAILLPTSGKTFRLADSTINKPKDRGITSHGDGCQGIFVDQCQFLSNEQALRVQDRTTIGLNVNTNDPKIRDNRIVRFAHFAVLAGSGNMLIGNHFFQGDDETAGVRRAGVIFTSTNIKTLITGNYIDNCFIEWGNEHDNAPNQNNEFSFGGLTVTGNIFTTNDVAASFRWFVVKPYGSGHFINGFSMSDNVFRTVNTNIDRIDALDTTFATLDATRHKNINITANAFNGVNQTTQTPVMIQHDQNTAAETWVIDGSAFLPFDARARNVQSIVIEDPIRNVTNNIVFETPYAQVEQGALGNLVNLRWPFAVRGRAHVTLRCDNDI